MATTQFRPSIPQRADWWLRPKHWQRAGLWAGIALLLLWTLFPIWWAVALSLKRPPDFFTAGWLPFIHFTPTLDHWLTEWQRWNDPAGMGRSLGGSVLVAATAGLLSTGLGGLAAYDLHLRRRSGAPAGQTAALALFLLLPRLAPPVVLALPLTSLLVVLGLGDTYLALIIANTSLGLPLATLVLFAGLSQLPADLLDAGRIDGCSGAAALRRLLLPLLRPALAVSFVLCAAQAWNEFTVALFNVQRHAQVVTLVVAALLTKDGVEFEYVGSHLVLVLLPPLLLALAAVVVHTRQRA